MTLGHSTNPKITVLMPVHNGAKFLEESIPSILNQTFTDFEFLIIDDKSTDNSYAIIQQFSDPRIIVKQNANNLGIAQTLNYGILQARGKYIARFDCDDFSLPKRLQIQFEYMEAHPEIIASGSNMQVFGDSNYIQNYPQNSPDIQCFLLFNSPLAHPSVIMRREILLKHQLFYRHEFLHIEDYELWSRMAGAFLLKNLPQCLIKYRIHSLQICKAHREKQIDLCRKIREINLQHFKTNFSAKELNIHHLLAERTFSKNYDELSQVLMWLNKLVTINKVVKYYQQEALENTLAHQAAALFCFWVRKKPLVLLAVFKLKIRKWIITKKLLQLFLCRI